MSSNNKTKQAINLSKDAEAIELKAAEELAAEELAAEELRIEAEKEAALLELEKSKLSTYLSIHNGTFRVTDDLIFAEDEQKELSEAQLNMTRVQHAIKTGMLKKA